VRRGERESGEVLIDYVEKQRLDDALPERVLRYLNAILNAAPLSLGESDPLEHAPY
jgi:hypothetical protein